jgi:hypothetical protein
MLYARLLTSEASNSLRIADDDRNYDCQFQMYSQLQEHGVWNTPGLARIVNWFGANTARLPESGLIAPGK